MFTWDEDSNYCWFNANSFETSDQYFLVGVVLGLAIYNSTILDIHLPLACYKKLLGVHCGLDDLRLFKPAVAASLEKLLAYDGDDFEEVFCLDFVTEREGFGQVQTVDLVPGGSKKPVTKANRTGMHLRQCGLMSQNMYDGTRSIFWTHRSRNNLNRSNVDSIMSAEGMHYHFSDLKKSNY